MNFLSSFYKGVLSGVLLLGWCASGAQAATFTVSTLADSGTGSLRQAIANSNATPAADTITFAAAVRGTLRSTELIINQSVTIQGPGSSLLALDGQGANRLLNITGGNVTLSGLTLKGGSSDAGAGISNSGTLTLSNCTLSGNQAFKGGAIYNSGSLALKSSVLSGNLAKSDMFSAIYGYGGAIYNGGQLTVTGSSFSNNNSPAIGHGDYGGAIYNSTGGAITIGSSTFTGNTTLSFGGALFNEGTVTLKGSTFSANSAGGRGGAISNQGLLSVTGCTFSGNSSPTSGSGGGIYNSGTFSTRNSTFSGNSANLGGAVSNLGTLSILNTTFNDNRAIGYSPRPPSGCSGRGCSTTYVAGRGGALFSDAPATSASVTNATFANNSVSGTRSSGSSTTATPTGGAINNASGDLSLLNCTFSGNADTSTGNLEASRVGTLVNAGTLSSRNSVFVAADSTPFSGFTLPPAGGDTNKNFAFTSAQSAGLDGLKNNGGPVFTLALKSGSPLLDKGLAQGAPPTDARGAARPQGQGVDVGAYETGAVKSGSYTLSGTITVSPGTQGVSGVPVTLTDASGRTVDILASDASGNWSFSDLLPGTYTATPRKSGYKFQPASRTVTITGASLSVSFVATPPNESLVVTTLVDEDNETSDVTIGSGTSLREAINFANSNPDKNTLSFKAGLKGTITLGGTALAISSDLVIPGPGASVLTVSGAGKSVVFNIVAGTASIGQLTLTGGSAGAVVNHSTLILTGCAVNGNKTGTYGGGGGLSNETGATATIDRCSFTGNQGYYGGGVYNKGTLTVTNSTLSGNNSSYGGGGIENRSSLTVANCTFSDNSGYDGGGINNSGSLKVTNCTIAGNHSARDGGGISNTSDISQAYVGNSILAGNTAASDREWGNDYYHYRGQTGYGDYNIVQSSDGQFLGGTGNINATDPKLGPLADNGGPTLTRALLPGSPAIDKGNTDRNTDQRGISRPQGSADDIGAFEVVVNAAPSLVYVAGPDGKQAKTAGSPQTVSPLLNGQSPANSFVTFTTKVRDLDGNTDLGNISFILGSGASELRLTYNAQKNLVSISGPNGTSASVAPGSANTLTVSTGALDAKATKVTRSGTDLTIAWSLKVTSASAVKQNIRLRAQDKSGALSPLLSFGTWTFGSSATTSPLAASANSF